MNSDRLGFEGARRTTADDVFERLRFDITNLHLVPGTKLSEVEIARQSDVSRQPVREAFIRLSNLNLLQVRPQKATLVRKISVRDILNTRFIRIAIEVEVVRRASQSANADNFLQIERNLAEQKKAVMAGDGSLFHELDYEFHRHLCVAANCEFAFDSIAENKSHVDRLCLLSLADAQGREDLYQDHSGIFRALKDGDETAIVKLTRLHLSRLDATLADARKNHPDYFED